MHGLKITFRLKVVFAIVSIDANKSVEKPKSLLKNLKNGMMYVNL
jgi:hypothetical protein